MPCRSRRRDAGGRWTGPPLVRSLQGLSLRTLRMPYVVEPLCGIGDSKSRGAVTRLFHPDPPGRRSPDGRGAIVSAVQRAPVRRGAGGRIRRRTASTSAPSLSGNTAAGTSDLPRDQGHPRGVAHDVADHSHASVPRPQARSAAERPLRLLLRGANHPRVTPCTLASSARAALGHSPKSPFPVTTTASRASILRVLPSRPRADAGGPFVAPDNRLLEHCRRSEPWGILGAMDADYALLQEATTIPPAGLRLRLPGIGRFRQGARTQRSGPVGTQRPLPPGDCDLLAPRTGRLHRMVGDRAEGDGQAPLTPRHTLPRPLPCRRPASGCDARPGGCRGHTPIPPA